MHWYTDVLKKYAVFDGRAGRPEFWWFELFNAIVAAIIFFVGLALGARYLVDLYWLAVLLPSLGVAIRRLHDTDRTGWWILMIFIPLVGSIVLIVFYILEGTHGPNRFGADPRDPDAVTAASGVNPVGFCAHCGASLEPGAAFCRNCGAATGAGQPG